VVGSSPDLRAGRRVHVGSTGRARRNWAPHFQAQPRPYGEANGGQSPSPDAPVTGVPVPFHACRGCGRAQHLSVSARGRSRLVWPRPFRSASSVGGVGQSFPGAPTVMVRWQRCRHSFASSGGRGRGRVRRVGDASIMRVALRAVNRRPRKSGGGGFAPKGQRRSPVRLNGPWSALAARGLFRVPKGREIHTAEPHVERDGRAVSLSRSGRARARGRHGSPGRSACPGSRRQDGRACGTLGRPATQPPSQSQVAVMAAAMGRVVV